MDELTATVPSYGRPQVHPAWKESPAMSERRMIYNSVVRFTYRRADGSTVVRTTRPMTFEAACHVRDRDCASIGQARDYNTHAILESIDVPLALDVLPQNEWPLCYD